jgi:hypothetical protein
MVKITFEEPLHELEDFDNMTARITDVIAIRSPDMVSVEDHWASNKQRAHVTSNTVFTHMLTHGLSNRTWVQAWMLLKSLYQFLHVLLTQWYSDARLSTGANVDTRKQLPDAIQTHIILCDQRLYRGNHSITKPLWGARRKDAAPTSWAWFDHKPGEGDNVKEQTHFVKEWKLLLTPTEVKALEDECEAWMTLRSRIPWTSVDTDSYVSGDRKGPNAVESAVAQATIMLGGAISKGSANDISDTIIMTFDFFPPSFTKIRTITHAAAVAARHLVEHFQYHPTIRPAWYEDVKNAFLRSWKAKVIIEIKDTNRDTSALRELLGNWPRVESEFNQFYGSFVKAVVSI